MEQGEKLPGRVRFVTTYPPTNCGIATYSSQYVDAIGKLCEVSVEPLELGNKNPLYFIRLAARARKGADLVHVQYELALFGERGICTLLFYPVLRLFGGPAVVTTVHDFWDVRKTYDKRLLYWPMRIFFTAIWQSIVLCSDTIMVHTEMFKEKVSQYGGTGKVDVVPQACLVRPPRLPQDSCKAKLGLSDKRIVTVFGYVNALKGHDLAIEAMQGMPEDVILYIAGDARIPADRPYADSLRNLTKSLGVEDGVIFHGYVRDEDAPMVICASDILLLPYRYVAQSASMNYSLAYGKPVLASDLPGFAEIAGKYGCIELFRSESVPDLREKLVWLLSDAGLTARLSRNVDSYCSAVGLDMIAGQIVEKYRLILTGKNK